MIKKFIFTLVFTTISFTTFADNVVDEIVWVIGDDPIFKSDIEQAIVDFKAGGVNLDGDPYSIITEQLALQKLFLHQADIDSIEVKGADVIDMVNEQINRAIQNAGSKSKLEEYYGKKISEIKEDLKNRYIKEQRVKEVKRKLVGDIKITPAEVRKFIGNIPKDSLPYIPTQVEVEIITHTPEPPRSEIERVEGKLRDFAQRVNNGESTFGTLAQLYSVDASARFGGELGLKGRAKFLPEFANVAFSLTDPKKVSRIVKTEYGYHIIQLIERKGDLVNVRHILLKPEISDSVYKSNLSRLDSIADDIRNKKFTFEEAAEVLSDDKETKNNHGLMVNVNQQTLSRSSRFDLSELPADVAKKVENMHVGEISDAFKMINEMGQNVCAIVKLKSKIDGHKASVATDFQALYAVVKNIKENEVLDNWIKEKQKSTYIRINKGWEKGNFKYPGWIKK